MAKKRINVNTVITKHEFHTLYQKGMTVLLSRQPLLVPSPDPAEDMEEVVSAEASVAVPLAEGVLREDGDSGIFSSRF